MTVIMMRVAQLLFGIVLAGTAMPEIAHAEQSKALGKLEVHYVLLTSTFLDAQVANRYGIVRARDRGLVNVTVLSATGKPRSATVSGTLKNLLGQIIELPFERLEDGDAIYYLAPFRFTDGELLRMEVSVQTADEGGGTLHIEQKMYWD